MSTSKVSQNITTIATAALVSFVVFLIGLGLLSVLPLPVNLRGPLKASTLVLTDARSSSSIILTTRPDGTPSVTITDAQGNSAFFLTVSEKGYPSLDISGPDETKFLSLTTGKQPSIKLYDPATDTVAFEVVGDATDPVKRP